MAKKAVKKDRSVTDNMRKSIKLILFPAFFLAFLAVAVNTFRISVLNYEKYKVLATDIQVQETEITPSRGSIYDANMKVLAQSATVWTITVDPQLIASKRVDSKGEYIFDENGKQVYEYNPETAEPLAKGLSETLDVDYDTVIEKLKKVNSRYQVIKMKADKPLADACKAYFDEENEKIKEYNTKIKNKEINGKQKSYITGYYIQEDYKRYYPYGTLASTILGFCGNDNQGLAGLESYYEEELAGTKGRIISSKNAKGYDIGGEYEVLNEAVDGYNLHLTIDETIQYYLEQALSEAIETNVVLNGASGIVMNVNTGAILAMASLPDYNPNDPYVLVDEQLYDSIMKMTDDEERDTRLSNARQAQWRNKAVNDLYEPGSVFKTITASAAMDAGTATINTYVRCNGSIQVEDRTFSCAHGRAHGSQNLEEALINSCNVGFIQYGQGLGIERFWDYFYSFGLSEKTGIDLPGESNSLYYDNETHTAVTLASCSFGQSNKITPIQMITAVATAVNGGNLVTPHIVSELLDNDGNVVKNLTPEIKRQVISESVSRNICKMLQDNCSSSGNAMNAYVAGYRVGGKSGTGEKLDGKKDEYVASFIGVAPCDNPEIAILIVLDTPTGPNGYYGGQTAGPVVGKLMGEILPYLGVERVYTASEKATSNVYVSSVTGYSVADATIKLQRQGLTVKTVGTGEKVKSQFPAYGSKVQYGGIVVLYTEDADETLVTVPDLTGKSASYVEKTMLSLGLNVEEAGAYSGNKGVTVSSTSPKAGEKIPMGSVVTVTYMASGAYE